MQLYQDLFMLDQQLSLMTFVTKYKLQLLHQYHPVKVLWHLSQLYFLLRLMTAFYCFCWLLPNLATLLMIFPIPFALLDLSSIFIESVISLITFPNLISFPLTLIIFFKGLQPLFLIQLL